MNSLDIEGFVSHAIELQNELFELFVVECDDFKLAVA